MLFTKWDVSTGKIAPYAVGKLRRHTVTLLDVLCWDMKFSLREKFLNR